MTPIANTNRTDWYVKVTNSTKSLFMTAIYGNLEQNLKCTSLHVVLHWIL